MLTAVAKFCPQSLFELACNDSVLPELRLQNNEQVYKSYYIDVHDKRFPSECDFSSSSTVVVGSVCSPTYPSPSKEQIK